MVSLGVHVNKCSYQTQLFPLDRFNKKLMHLICLSSAQMDLSRTCCIQRKTMQHKSRECSLWTVMYTILLMSIRIWWSAFDTGFNPCSVPCRFLKGGIVAAYRHLRGTALLPPLHTWFLFTFFNLLYGTMLQLQLQPKNVVWNCGVALNFEHHFAAQVRNGLSCTAKHHSCDMCIALF